MLSIDQESSLSQFHLVCGELWVLSSGYWALMCQAPGPQTPIVLGMVLGHVHAWRAHAFMLTRF